MIVYVNGKFLKRAEAKVSVFDHGFLYGDNIFETLRIYNGKIFRFDKHFSRLKNSGSLLRLSFSFSRKKIKEICDKLITKNKLKEAKLRITITRGVGAGNLDPTTCPVPGLIVVASKFKPYPQELYKKGIKVKVLKIRKNIPGAIPYDLNSGNYLSQVLAKKEALKYKSFEGLMLNHRQEVAEGIISNFFMVKDGVLFTPSLNSGCLNGITRGEVVKLAKGLGIRVKEGVVRRKDLCKAQEAFLTSTLMEIIPIRKIDNHNLGNPGPLTKRLMKEFKGITGRARKK